MNRIVGTALLLSLLGFIVLAQSKTGTTVGQFTLIEPSARSAAMGGAGGTSSGEVMAGYYNPGALAALDHSDIQFTYNAWFADIHLSYAAAAFRLGELGTVGLFVTHLGSGDINVTTVEQPQGTGERYSVNDLLVGVAYGYQVTDRFSAGIQVNYVTERIWHSSLANFGINIGTLYQLSDDGLRIGASLVNFGTSDHYSGTDMQIRYDLDPARYGDNSAIPGELTTDNFSLPIVFRVGLGYPWKFDESHTVNLAVDALHPSDNSECVNLGAEWVFRRILALRVGYANLWQRDSEFGLTAGGGLMWDGLGYEIRFDYGWADHKRLGNVQRVTLGIGL
ncbi:MAG: hypothetical protein H6Q30_2555 [Bacteroidetes bacterium]|nr:hypothetical protein [Bacteroidota bacterium]